MMEKFGFFDAYDISKEQIHYPESLTELHPLSDGQIFDLGGRQLITVHTPGTPSVRPYLSILPKKYCSPEMPAIQTSAFFPSV
ncbi:MAG: hypothetical protein LUH00_04610 [Lachnospiraceae bacterium]|nr:hypothetical protein [Lachnospiraceae bacterium]